MDIILDRVSVVKNSLGAEGSKRAILNSISCALHAGEITLLVGQTGAGKSTLLDVISGLERPVSGTVTIGDKALWLGKRPNQVATKSLCVGFQAPDEQLFARTVLGEFGYSLRLEHLSRSQLRTKAERSLAQFGLPEAVVDESPFNLSQGQKRRVALATTFASNPDWLLLDEPTAGLDPQSVHEFVRTLTLHMAEMRGGVVIATHDLDTFLPIANRVVFLQNGHILANASPEEVLRDKFIWENSAVGRPTALEFAEKLGCELDIVSYRPEAVARSIVNALQTSRADRPGGAPVARKSQLETETTVSAEPASDGTATPQTREDDLLDKSDSTFLDSRWVKRGVFLWHLDPRAKWLAYILLSVGMLLQLRWPGLAVATLLTVVIVKQSQLPIRPLARLSLPFVLLIVVSVAVSGLHFDAAAPSWHLWIQGISLSTAANTFVRLYRFLLILFLGLVLSATTSQLKMKVGLEQSLRGLKRLRLPVEAFSLAVSLTLRFIPIIMGELQRFTRIAQARGKRGRFRRGIPLRDLPVIILPLLLSILKIADELSTALEARGYHSVGQPRTSSVELKFSPKEWQVLAWSVLGFLLLWGVSKL